MSTPTNSPRLTTISRSFTFDAAHRLPQMPPEHKCHRLHGHTYRVRVELTGPLQADGMVYEWGELDEFLRRLHDIVDHRYLNDLHHLAPTTSPIPKTGIKHQVPQNNPTAENMARWIYDEVCSEYGTAFGIRIIFHEGEDGQVIVTGDESPAEPKRPIRRPKRSNEAV